LPGEFTIPFKRKNLSIHIRALIARECKSAIVAFVASSETNLTTNGNLGDFSRYASNKFCCKSTIGPIQDFTGCLTTDSEHKAEILQKAFLNNYSVDNGYLPSMEKRTLIELSRVYLTPHLVRRVIKKLHEH
jgi:hypothetical protein